MQHDYRTAHTRQVRSYTLVSRSAVRRDGDWTFLAAQQLLALPAAEAVSVILREIGILAAVDRAWMFEYDAALLRFRNTHEWCRGGVVSHVEDLQDAPVTMIAWLHRGLVKGQAVAIHDVTQLPRPARALQAEMLRQNDKSVLSVPIFHDGKLRACIGFDTTRTMRAWSLEETLALGDCAALIGLALYRERAVADVQKAAPLLYLRQRGGLRGVTLDEILGLRSARDYTHVWLTDGSMILDTRAFAIWLALLPTAGFLRVHRTAIVNLQHISGLERSRGTKDSWQLNLRGIAAPWTVSRPYRQELRTRIGV